jgi:ubiquinone/menaquinone biosynthesis C-methylase UbiE
MDSETLIPFINPENGNKLRKSDSIEDSCIVLDRDGNEYKKQDGIYDLIYPQDLKDDILPHQLFYDNRASQYESCLHLTFKTHNLDEIECRNKFIDNLNINRESKVLEIGCGTGRDSTLIADRIPDGELHLVDISTGMLKICQKKLVNKEVKNYISLANVSNLPYPDSYFDAIYSFGGLGEFPDIKASLAEMVRVGKVGGKVVVGDESMPIWLKNSYFAKVLTETNPQFNAELPLNHIPIEARNFNLKYVINGIFYLIDFEIGEGEPVADFDYKIPGLRGGSYRTRYEGKLEGVTSETKEKVIQYCKQKKISVHEFLETTLIANMSE